LLKGWVVKILLAGFGKHKDNVRERVFTHNNCHSLKVYTFSKDVLKSRIVCKLDVFYFFR
jgi:hypothetical protein